MKRRSTVFFAVLMSVLLLCGCAAQAAVKDREEAETTLIAYLHDFVYAEDDAYVCEYAGEQTLDGETVYCFEAFWDKDGEQFPLGVFGVFPDGTVIPENIQ